MLPAFSPDGRWLAYVSNETGREEVYVQPFPGPGGKWQISTDGGSFPVWARNGRELFYRSGEKLMSVTVTTQPVFRAGTPRVLFEARFAGTTADASSYDVARDGQRILAVRPGENETEPTQLHVVLEWFEDVKRRVPSGGK